MKPRCELTVCEVASLRNDLKARMHGMLQRTQPEVASRVLELTNDPNAGLSDFAKVVRTDQALSGRLLRMVNSAYYAQRHPVTAIERACVLLGLDRLKAIVLGFCLSRSTGDPECALSRKIWGESIFRACLAAQLGPAGSCGLAGEGFIIGLMLDAGIPLMYRLLGEPFMEVYEQSTTPAQLYEREFEELPYTHVDVITALLGHWGLPELLTRPVEWHHTRPGDHDRSEPVYKLQRVAFYVGSLTLQSEGGVPAGSAPNLETAENILGVSASDLRTLVNKAQLEYAAMLGLFGDVAESIKNIEALADRAHVELVETVDGLVARAVVAELEQTPRIIKVGDNRVEIEHTLDGAAVVFLYDSGGMRLVSYRFIPGTETGRSLLDALGVETIDDEALAQFDRMLLHIAA